MYAGTLRIEEPFRIRLEGEYDSREACSYHRSSQRVPYTSEAAFVDDRLLYRRAEAD